MWKLRVVIALTVFLMSCQQQEEATIDGIERREERVTLTETDEQLTMEELRDTIVSEVREEILYELIGKDLEKISGENGGGEWTDDNVEDLVSIEEKVQELLNKDPLAWVKDRYKLMTVMIENDYLDDAYYISLEILLVVENGKNFHKEFMEASAFYDKYVHPIMLELSEGRSEDYDDFADH